MLTACQMAMVAFFLCRTEHQDRVSWASGSSPSPHSPFSRGHRLIFHGQFPAIRYAASSACVSLLGATLVCGPTWL